MRRPRGLRADWRKNAVYLGEPDGLPVSYCLDAARRMEYDMGRLRATGRISAGHDTF
jgi:hypothetical protein